MDAAIGTVYDTEGVQRRMQKNEQQFVLDKFFSNSTADHSLDTEPILAGLMRAIAQHNERIEELELARKPEMFALNMIQRRKRKMNKHKYQKLRDKTRALRRKQGKT